MSTTDFDFDLVIIGAGFSGLNALAAAVEFAPELKIAVVEASNKLGGHWNTTYPFVRLHHKAYGIGTYGLVGQSNTRSDILSYAKRVYDEIMSRTDLDVTFLWDTKYLGYSFDHSKTMIVRTTNGKMTAGRLIDTVRYGIPASCSEKPLGILPRDLPDMPPASSYVIIGSGKTAMDTLRFLGRPATVISGTPIAFINRHKPMLITIGKALASVVDDGGDHILEHMHENGDVFFFMGKRANATWRFGFTDAQEIAEAEACVQEYLHNTYVDGYERGDTLRLLLRDGKVLEFDKDTILVDCRGIMALRNTNPKPNVHALDNDHVLNTFVTDFPDSHSAYTMTAMFLQGKLENLQKFKVNPGCLQRNVTMRETLRYVLEMTKARRSAPISDATREMVSNIGWFDMFRLWWIKDKISEGKRILSNNE
jgi:hypothetical protein